MISLPVKYRPQTFEDVCSQDSIITILKRQLELKEFKNCYLFCGASGCGKTTVARIFANEINEHQGNPIEIDGASNNGVDNVRQIIESASERSLDSKYKIVIIDECHALTSQAWQAFLKCIEEPPEFTIFIFCTTDPQKIPETILNRVMRFNFTRVNTDIIKTRLEFICQQEGYTNYQDTCDYISRIAQGSMRQAISLLDKAAAYNTDLNIDSATLALGEFSYSLLLDTLIFIKDKTADRLINLIEYVYSQGTDLKVFIDQLLSFCLDVAKYTIFNDINMTKIPSSLIADLNTYTSFENSSIYYRKLSEQLLDCKNIIKYDTNIKSTLEVYLLSLMN